MTNRFSFWEQSPQPKNFPLPSLEWVANRVPIQQFRSSQELFCVQLKKISNRNEEGRSLVIVHGFGEHSGRYLHFPFFLSEIFDEIWLYDLRGHGQSDGQRGHIDSFEQYEEDLRIILEKAGSESDGLHLFGHSLGGLIVLRTLQRYPETHTHWKLRSASVSSPLIGIKVKLPPLKTFIGRVMSNVYGKLKLTLELNTSQLTHDPEVLVAHDRDPLIHHQVSPRYYTEILNALDQIEKIPFRYKGPLLFQVARDDLIVDAAKAESWFDHLSHDRKAFIGYEKMYHEIFNEVEKEKPFGDLKRWLKTNFAISS